MGTGEGGGVTVQTTAEIVKSYTKILPAPEDKPIIQFSILGMDWLLGHFIDSSVGKASLGPIMA